MKGQSALLSSTSVEWSTPQWLYDRLNTEFNFDLDPCSDGYNAKCRKFYTTKNNSLNRKWTGSVFMNPPYGKTIGDWVRKAFLESQKNAKVVVCLLPARTDTEWWHRYCIRGEIIYVRGRLKFGDSLNPATFPSVVVVFRNPVERRYRFIKFRE